MVTIASLWLPILLSAVFVFIASSIIHMFLGYHASDFKKLPEEDAAADALRKLNVPEGRYVFPHASSMKEMGSPEFKEKLKKGPRGVLSIWPGGSVSMTSNLIGWFIYCLVVGIFAAYVASRALDATAPYLAVFRFAGVTAFACYIMGGWQETVWFRRPVSVSLKNTIDGLIYALLTGGTFGWLWPHMGM